MPNAEYRVGVVGAGRMGANIARHLKEEGFTIAAIHDVRADVAREVAEEVGADSPSTLAGVTRAADYVLTVVTDDQAMDRIFAESGDSLLQGASGRLFVNCATVSPSIHAEVERRAERAGAQSIEACMASSIPQARQGTLYLMCAGKREAFERARPLLEAMSASLRFVGEEPGKAAQVKALVNMVMNINTAGLAEGLGLGAALGLDLAMLREVFGQTGAASRVLETDGEDMQNRDHECYFSAAHAAKDSGIALELEHTAGLNLPLAEATKRQYDRLVAAGKGELDKSAIAELTFPGRG